MKCCIAFVLFTILHVALAGGKQARSLQDDFIAEINTKQKLWVAGKNFPENTTYEELKSLCGVLAPQKYPNQQVRMVFHENVIRDNLPDSFDARDTWPECESIKQIRNQESCGSCWAFSSAEAMTDRLCIHSAGGVKFKFSPEDIISCCSDCGNGCGGGYILQAYEYWDSQGIVSGGDYGSNEGCRPYSEQPAKQGQTPQCNRACVGGYGKNYNDDRRFGKAAYQITPTIDQIEYELVVNGPVSTQYEVFEDFYAYKNGIYKHTSGNSVGWHAVKIIGYGTENGTPYWLIANSWGTGFGELGGFFKMIRGQNDCSIETWVYGGIPVV